MKYRKKPVVVDAVLWTGENVEEVSAFTRGHDEVKYVAYFVPGCVYIHTPEGVMAAMTGDWIIKGIKGELYPCKPDIFAATYEEITE